MKIQFSERFRKVPPYPFAEMANNLAKFAPAGVSPINLAIADPDLAPASHIIKALQVAVENPHNSMYSSSAGLPEYRRAIAQWMQQRFALQLDADKEITALIGSKEGIASLPTLFINPGDVVLIPSPGYPPYAKGCLLAEGEPYFMPLLRDNHFLPDFSAIPADILQRAKLMFLNYPNNPTGAVTDLAFWEKAVAFARQHNIVIASDLTYCEHYEQVKPPSMLQVEGGRDVGIEFYSLSKTYNMAGWRIGWVCGNSEVVAALRGLKAHVDNGIFPAVQRAAIVALESDQRCVADMRAVYARRRILLREGLQKLGWDICVSPLDSGSGLALWVAVPQAIDSMTFALDIFAKTGVAMMPGIAFGAEGEGFLRISLTQNEQVLNEALQRLAKVVL